MKTKMTVAVFLCIMLLTACGGSGTRTEKKLNEELDAATYILEESLGKILDLCEEQPELEEGINELIDEVVVSLDDVNKDTDKESALQIYKEANKKIEDFVSEYTKDL